MGGAFSAVRDAFGSASNSTSDANDEDKDAIAIVGVTIMLTIVSLALLGGCLITAVIIRYYAGTVPLPERDISYFLAQRVETGSRDGTTSSEIDYSSA